MTAAFAVAAALAVHATPVNGGDANAPTAASCEDGSRGLQPPLARSTGLTAPVAGTFDIIDKKAALESVQYALSSIGDGASYVWHRGHGKLSGVIQPTLSFKDAKGNVCRHFVVVLASGTYTKRTETVACRMPSGIWRLDG